MSKEMFRTTTIFFVIFYAILIIVSAAPTNSYKLQYLQFIQTFAPCGHQTHVKRRYFLATAPTTRGPQYTVNKGPEHRSPFIEVRNSTYHGAGPREEARAMCSVKTHEVNATANATITRRLHGVVTSRELHSSIQRLEVIIFGQMQQLWQSLDALRAQLGSGSTYSSYPDRRTVSFRFKPNGV